MLAREPLRRRELPKPIFRRAPTGEKIAGRCEGGSHLGEDVLETDGATFQKRAVTGRLAQMVEAQASMPEHMIVLTTGPMYRYCVQPGA